MPRPGRDQNGSFGGGSNFETDFQGSFDEALRVAVQPDGNIVAVAAYLRAIWSHFGLVRYRGGGGSR